MTKARLATLAKHYRRWNLAATTGLVVVLWALALQLDVQGVSFESVLTVVVALGAMKVPLVLVDSRTRLRTDATPEAVRTAFTSADAPTQGLARGAADAVERFENGGEYVVTWLGMTGSTYYWAEQRPDGRILAHAGKGDDEYVTQEIRISDEGEYTEVVLDGATRRLSLLQLYAGLIRSRFHDRALRAQGYEVVDDRAKLSLLR